MIESDFIRKVHGKLPREIYRWKISDRFTAGVPDAYYSGKSDLWIEYKLEKTPTQNIRPKLTELQKQWLRERYHEGRNVAVVVGLPKGFLLFRELEWEKSKPLKDQRPLQELITFITDECNAKTIRT